MKLLIVRHAIAMEREEYRLQVQNQTWRSSQKRSGRRNGTLGEVDSDDFRPLTDEGIRKMRKNAKGLVSLVKRPGLVLTSPLTRAVQTAKILEDGWRADEHPIDVMECEALRPGTAPELLLKWISSKKKLSLESGEDGVALTLVGHEPHLSSLVSWLMTGESRSVLDIKKGGACLLRFPRNMDRGKATLMWLATPSILRRSV